MNSIIKVENISKAYRIGVREQKHDTLGSAIASWVKSPFRNFKKLRSLSNFNNQDEADIFWALKDINFNVKQGEVFGIIGKNGAGKSTLLRILSRITEPTTGRIEIFGRVASLLEVGTGFNPELSGRDNIYLNGTILGMTKKEIDLKFDEIISFSGVEKFIDTPVKRYSSGMKVRLAFSVAAHLDPEILIIDEVLAVGDAEFQRKCLGKMRDVADKEGRTVLFVSHNMAAVKTLCTKGLVIEKGRLILNDDIDLAVAKYLGNPEGSVISYSDLSHIHLEGILKLISIEVFNTSGTYTQPIVENQPIEIKLSMEMYAHNPDAYNISYHLFNEVGEALFSFYNEDAKWTRGENQLLCTIPANFFQSGNYSLSVFIVENKRRVLYKEHNIVSFTVIDGGRELGVYMGREPGYIRPVFTWTNH